jgi:hypothetical protein
MQEWQANQRERTKEWHAYRQKEEAEEETKSNEYREIGMRMKAYPQEEVCKARVLVSSFIRAGEDVENVTECILKNLIWGKAYYYAMFLSLPLSGTTVNCDLGEPQKRHEQDMDKCDTTVVMICFVDY